MENLHKGLLSMNKFTYVSFFLLFTFFILSFTLGNNLICVVNNNQSVLEKWLLAILLGKGGNMKSVKETPLRSQTSPQRHQFLRQHQPSCGIQHNVCILKMLHIWIKEWRVLKTSKPDSAPQSHLQSRSTSYLM